MPKTLASFCRLCLTKTSSKVPVFGGEQENVTNLLALIELSINPESESNAGICLNCIVTLEGFQQFKEQCHENDKFLKTVPPKGGVQVPEAGEENEQDDAMECDYLEGDAETEHSEEEGLVADDEPLVENPNTKIPKATQKPPEKLITSETSDSEEEEPPKTPKKTVPAESPSTETAEVPKMQPEKLITSRRVNLFDVESSTRVRKQIARPPLNPRTDLIELSKVLEEKYRGPEPTEDDLPKLLDSYPDTFHFVKSTPHAKFYTLVYYGEPYNSAVYEYAKTYYRCAYKRQFQCPALLHVSNDYTEFERRFEHTHDEQEPKKTRIKPVLLTPRQALPDIFRRCWHKLEQKKIYRQHQHSRVFRKYTKKKKKVDKKKKPAKKESSQSESGESDDYNEEGVWW